MFRLVFGALPFRRHWRNRPRKSGGPSLFELSLNIQRNVAHIQNSGFVAPVSRGNARGPSKVHGESRRARRRDRPALLGASKPKPAPAGFPESWRGRSAFRVCIGRRGTRSRRRGLRARSGRRLTRPYYLRRLRSHASLISKATIVTMVVTTMGPANIATSVNIFSAGRLEAGSGKPF